MASPILGLQWSLIGYALAVLVLALTVGTFRAATRAGNSILGWLLTIVGVVATIWTVTSSNSAEMVPLMDPDNPGRIITCYTRDDVDWLSECGREYAHRLEISIVPALVVAAVLALYLVTARRRAFGGRNSTRG